MNKPDEIDWEWSEGDLEVLRDTVMEEIFERLDKEEGEEDVIRSNEQK